MSHLCNNNMFLFFIECCLEHIIDIENCGSVSIRNFL